MTVYLAAPLDRLAEWPIGVWMFVGIVTLAVAIGWQVQQISNAPYRGIRAIEALASTVSLYLILFSMMAYFMSASDPASFSEPLSRIDALYFTVTVLATVGFGDISATSQIARLVVTAQMILNVVGLGVGIRLIIRASGVNAPPPGSAAMPTAIPPQ